MFYNRKNVILSIYDSVFKIFRFVFTPNIKKRLMYANKMLSLNMIVIFN